MRGKTYTFVVEGGDDKVTSLLYCFDICFSRLHVLFSSSLVLMGSSLQKFAAGYHPFYITDDPEGGYEFKNAQERRKVITLWQICFKSCFLLGVLWSHRHPELDFRPEQWIRAIQSFN